ncbi:VirD4-like conjugal transfer protein, CD1115 family [Paenibacillus crassostreae]|uniref:Type IV secretion system protein n=1 Tax=Paenibacillus crassostreae TaxID=1763538 RepID=A0A167EI92_9BACL|nr:type IV secretory system conjugative DNA transfer family protein [Paenibacillus crassostreae]AOZ94887.1 type IV secretion system protein [Paenibacillus crassostreae]OAB75570.1 type IV secretion system protein [Paenibacillus crassostreae]
MELKKKAWKPIFVSFLLAIIFSYLLMVGFYFVGPGGDITQLILEPMKVIPFAYSQENLKVIFSLVPFVMLGALLYSMRTSIILPKLIDASDFGLHGTSKWGQPSDVVNGKTFSKKNSYSKDPISAFKIEPGIILGKVPNKKELIIMPKGTNVDNRNVLVIGSSGSGKGQAYVFPNMLNHIEETIIVTDPKGEIYEATHQLKRDQGYIVYQIDFVNFSEEVGYNPLDYVKDDEDARAVANTIASNAVDDGKRDFWSESAIGYFAAIILYIKTEYGKTATMTHVVQFTAKSGKDEEYLDTLLEDMPADHPAYDMFTLANMSAGNTRTGIMSTLAQQIGIFAMRKIAKFTTKSEFNFRDLQKEKTILYIKVRMKNNPFKQLTATFFEQLIDTFYDIADENNSRLPIDSIYLLDEFANIGKINGYPNILATCRGLGMSMHTVIQDIGQLEDKRMYGPDIARSIINNHDTTLFLRTKDTKTAKYFSDVAGETTIKHKQKSTSIGDKNASKSVSEQYVKRPLITQGELLNVNPAICYLFVNGYFPLKLEKSYQYKIYGEFLFSKDRKPNYERDSRERFLKFFGVNYEMDVQEYAEANISPFKDGNVFEDDHYDQGLEAEMMALEEEMEQISEDENLMDEEIQEFEYGEGLTEEELSMLLGNFSDDLNNSDEGDHFENTDDPDPEDSLSDEEVQAAFHLIEEALNRIGEDDPDAEALREVIQELTEEETATKDEQEGPGTEDDPDDLPM